MPNRNSKAGHIPIRSCVVCRRKRAQDVLMSFILLPGGIVFDPRRLLSARKHYICPSLDCLALLPKWRKRRLKGRRS